MWRDYRYMIAVVCVFVVVAIATWDWRPGDVAP